MLDFITGSLSALLGLFFSSSGGELAAVVRSPFPREPALRLTLTISLLALLTASILTRDGIFGLAALLPRWPVLLALIPSGLVGVWLGHRSNTDSPAGLIWLLAYGAWLLLYPFVIGHQYHFHPEFGQWVAITAASLLAGYYTGRFGVGAEPIYVFGLAVFTGFSFSLARTFSWAAATVCLFVSLVLVSRHRPRTEGVLLARRLPATSAIIGALLASWLAPKPAWPWASLAMGCLVIFCAAISLRSDQTAAR